MQWNHCNPATLLYLFTSTLSTKLFGISVKEECIIKVQSHKFCLFILVDDKLTTTRNHTLRQDKYRLEPIRPSLDLLHNTMKMEVLRAKLFVASLKEACIIKPQSFVTLDQQARENFPFSPSSPRVMSPEGRLILGGPPPEDNQTKLWEVPSAQLYFDAQDGPTHRSIAMTSITTEITPIHKYQFLSHTYNWKKDDKQNVVKFVMYMCIQSDYFRS